jgi:hypothetical protein
LLRFTNSGASTTLDCSSNSKISFVNGPRPTAARRRIGLCAGLGVDGTDGSAVTTGSDYSPADFCAMSGDSVIAEAMPAIDEARRATLRIAAAVRDITAAARSIVVDWMAR